MGDINEEISPFQTKCEENGCQGDELIEKKMANYVNMFMVGCILSKLCYPICCHASIGLTREQLFPLVWEATRILKGI